ncbi:MAG TPA: hypothetical protein VIX63_09855 [Vicinamibacterales bacterium]
MNARALVGVAGAALALSAGLTAAGLIWMTATDPLRVITLGNRMLALLW